ncbi:MAG: Lrp/AsnC ligand binding domain-containing protein [Candidatus Brockarchaeota archaeon]|nr:Lrp/AsnC ligand binding domain-containing protein [Candidatus Brockarchaeota archaeon]
MASHAYVLINVEIGAEGDVVKQLEANEGVKEAWVVYGVYDIVAKVEAENTDKLKEVISDNIRRLDGVRNTLTLIPIEGFEKKRQG